jgi:hypothetical protein
MVPFRETKALWDFGATVRGPWSYRFDFGDGYVRAYTIDDIYARRAPRRAV